MILCRHYKQALNKSGTHFTVVEGYNVYTKQNVNMRVHAPQCK